MAQVGDKPGHPFRGNQYGGAGAGGTQKIFKSRVDAAGNVVTERDYATERQVTKDSEKIREIAGVVTQTIKPEEWATKPNLREQVSGKMRGSFGPGGEIKWRDETVAEARAATPKGRAKARADQIQAARDAAAAESERRMTEADKRLAAQSPDLDHLSRENKLPAKVSDVPAGGRGAYSETAGVTGKSLAPAPERDLRVTDREREILRQVAREAGAPALGARQITPKPGERARAEREGRQLAKRESVEGALARISKESAVLKHRAVTRIGRLAADEIQRSRRAGYGPLRGPRGGR